MAENALIRLAALCVCAALGVTLQGCASTIEQTKGEPPNQTRTVTKVGFGNKIKLETCEIAPYDKVVDAGERGFNAVINKASDAFLMRIADAVTSESRVR